MAATTRSPLKDKPLRLPGQSLEEERLSLWDDKIEMPLLMALFYVLLAGLEWWRYFSDMKPHPIIFSLMAAGGAAFAAWRFFRFRPRMRSLRLGIDGEKAVGQFLERLRDRGYHVFHDVVAPGFNVDHVLVGSAGVFAVETKTWSKPLYTDARIKVEGDRLLVAGQEPDRNPIVQARAQAAWLKTLLAESTGRAHDVFPVVLFPGWFVEPSQGPRPVWVLEPKALPAFLEREPVRLSTEEASLAAFHLSRFIRSAERQR